MTLSFVVCGVVWSAGRGQFGLGGFDQVVGDARALDEDSAGVAHRFDERRRPHVLPDQQGGRRVRFQFGGGVLDVLLADEPADLTVEGVEQGDVVVVLELDGLDVAVGVLA